MATPVQSGGCFRCYYASRAETTTANFCKPLIHERGIFKKLKNELTAWKSETVVAFVEAKLDTDIPFRIRGSSSTSYKRNPVAHNFARQWRRMKTGNIKVVTLKTVDDLFTYLGLNLWELGNPDSVSPKVIAAYTRHGKEFIQ